jgi:hypothetical protein
LTVAGLAARLGVKKHWVYRNVASQEIDSDLYIRFKGRIYLFPDEPEVIEPIRQLLPPRFRMKEEPQQ